MLSPRQFGAAAYHGYVGLADRITTKVLGPEPELDPVKNEEWLQVMRDKGVLHEDGSWHPGPTVPRL